MMKSIIKQDDEHREQCTTLNLFENQYIQMLVTLVMKTKTFIGLHVRILKSGL